MPKFLVTTARTVVTNFTTVEIEAEDKEKAQELAEEMIEDDELSNESEETTYVHNVESE